MKRLIFCLFFISSFTQLSSQISENFDDGNLSNWEGDISDFIVNTNGQLQLSAASAGESFIYIPTNFYDSLIWSLDVDLSFSPSGSNKLEIFLGFEDPTNPTDNALALELGESGSNDAINFVRYIDGTKTTLASGTMGRVATPFGFDFEILRNSLAEWIMSTTDLETSISEEEFRLILTEDPLPQMNYFGMRCTYTSSRTEGFTFDNIMLTELVPDLIAPELSSIDLINGNEICISFNEALTSNTATDLSNYTLTPTIEIIDAQLDASGQKITLTLQAPLESGVEYQIGIQGISDLFNNIITPTDRQLMYFRSPEPGEILVNEILFDPYSDGEDFVEFINAANEPLRLTDFFITNDDKPDEEFIDLDLILEAGEIIAFTSDLNATEDIYLPPESANIFETDIPAFNNADGNVSLYINNGIGQRVFIDGFDYQEDYHYNLLRDTEGVSLERISLIADSNDPSNWFSASANTLFATPGYANSVRSDGNTSSDSAIELEYQVFSPNNDAVKDILIMNYKLDNPGFVGTIQIYSDRGHLIKTIINNTLLGTEGVYYWDGTNQEGRLAPIGMYIVLYELFNSNGEIKKGKEVCVLGQRLN
ncbi:MAG: hypothetical protein HKN09_01665 [Saprospiraceae bacterium]|nr:hypothetical protein [Saprospiraceae bacterium]